MDYIYRRLVSFSTKFNPALFSVLIIMLILTAGSDSAVPDSQAGEDSKKVTIRYGGSSWLGHYPVWVGIKMNIFQEKGLAVLFQQFPTSSARMGALIAKDLDFASTGSISAIALMAAGVKSFYMIGTQDSYATVEGIIVRGEDIRSVKDLRGKKLAVPFASSAHLLVLDILEREGLDARKDIKLINLKTTEMPAAFKTGEVDACAVWTPMFNKILAMSEARLLLDDKEFSLYKAYGLGPGPDLLVIRKAFAENHPNLSKTFLEGYFQSVELLKHQPDACARELIDLTGLELKEQLLVLKDIDWYGLESQQEMMKEQGSFLLGLQKLAFFLEKKGLIDHSPIIKKWVNTRLLQKK